eukprot:5369171-Alexandrium_andersonii.AAC.1
MASSSRRSAGPSSLSEARAWLETPSSLRRPWHRMTSTTSSSRLVTACSGGLRTAAKAVEASRTA